MKTSSIAIIAALATFTVSPVFAQDTNDSTTGQQIQQPADANPAVDPAASGADTSTGTAQTTPPMTDPATGTADTTTPSMTDPATGTAETTTPSTTDPATGTAQTTTPSTTAGSDMATTADAAGERFVTTQSTEQFLGSKLMGAKVRSAANEDIGDVNDVLFDMTGKGVAVVVGVGGFLGIGEKNVAVPFDRLTITRQDGDVDDLEVSLETTKDELNAAPDFRRAEDTNATAEGVTPATNDPNATGSTTGTDMNNDAATPVNPATPPASNAQ